MRRTAAQPIVAVLSLAFVITIMAFVTDARAGNSQSASNLNGTVGGIIRDSDGHALVGVQVVIQKLGRKDTQAASNDRPITLSDTQGRYRLAGIREGQYQIEASKNGYLNITSPKIKVIGNGKAVIDLTMLRAAAKGGRPSPPDSDLKAPQGSPAISQLPELYDEPQFTVSGVTQADSGGHGSDATTRATEALARQTSTLADPAHVSDPLQADDSSRRADSDGARETELRIRLSRDTKDFEANQQLGSLLLERGRIEEAKTFLTRAIGLREGDAESHYLLARADESLNDPLNAALEYQRAAEIEPSEPYLFVWGTELLSHRALEPATEVFQKGNRRFPKSARMLVALGVAWYSRGFYDRAAQSIEIACDLNSANPAPYLFLGKLQELHVSPLPGALERLARLVNLHPQDALSPYYYAIALSRALSDTEAGAGGTSGEKRQAIEKLFEQSVALDPNFASPHLQLGIIFFRSGDLPRAVSEYRKVIDSPSGDPDIQADAHYRLAQAQLRMGNKAEAEREFALHRELKKKTQDDAVRRQRNLQQFVVSLKRSAEPPEAH